MTALAAAVAALTITVWPQGMDGPSKRWTLRCDPLGGTHPARAAACRRLDALASPFEPIPKDAVCTQIYGGPAVAVVTGEYRGKRIWARFRRRDGCEIARWKRLRPLLPAAGA
jgi:Subtilisin inhibitor-like